MLRRIPLWLCYLDADGQQFEEIVLPLDIQTRPSGEWLVLRHANGNTGELRLDQLQRFEERPSTGGSDKD
ncbi:MAG: hypothetical protein ACYCZJ_12060 [Sulfuriferula sp.]